MSEYIRKQDAINIAESYEVKREGFYLNDYEYGRDQVANSIASDLEDVEPADVAPVVHAHWRDTGSGQECSACKEIQYGYDTGRHYCANCGAKMDAQEEE